MIVKGVTLINGFALSLLRTLLAHKKNDFQRSPLTMIRLEDLSCCFSFLHRVYPWLRGLGYTSLTVFLLGFLLWNIDNIFCDSLRNFRKRVPPVLGVTTQFHAWWHILTGLGSYLHILFSLYTRTLYLRYRPKVKFLFGIWPAVMFEPQRKH